MFTDEEYLRRKVRVLADYLFGPGAGDVLLEGEVRFEFSRRTERLRHIFVDGKLVATFRAHDGMLALTIEGARRVKRALPFPKLRVVVKEEASRPVAEGRSVFAKHVLYADPDIRPGMDVLVVDPNDNLLAVGRAVLSGEEMVTFNSGIAVKVRSGILREKAKSKGAEEAQ
ncbi:MAG: pseudouridine synthase [Thermoprotei archaeon]|nr:MAG: pseudouridine synthase [Thermoprotei archaeon]RLF25454.1 MAG: pseudouridine synthase [Thermoprotei archaeon]